MKEYIHQGPANIQKILEVRVCRCEGVYVGKCLLTSCERIIRKETLIPFCLNTIRLDTLLPNKQQLQDINTISELNMTMN